MQLGGPSRGSRERGESQNALPCYSLAMPGLDFMMHSSRLGLYMGIIQIEDCCGRLTLGGGVGGSGRNRPSRRSLRNVADERSVKEVLEEKGISGM